MSLIWVSHLETEANMRQIDEEFEQYFWDPYSQQPEPVPVSYVKRDLAQAALLSVCLFIVGLGLFAWVMYR